MDGEVGTYSTSSIREQRRYEEKRIALQERRLAVRHRRLAALAKIDEGHEELEQAEHENEELEQAERELEALGREGTSSEQPVEAEGLEQLAEAVTEEPKTISERSKYIMKEQPGIKLSPRDFAVKFYANGWVEAGTSMDVILQRLRHSLRRLADRDPHIERDESGITHYFWYVSHPDGDAPVPAVQVNGASHTALQGGRTMT